MEEATIRAIIQRRYGRPDDVLELTDIDPPQVKSNQVLVGICSAAMHPDVWHVVTGYPRVLRVMGAGVFRPRVRVPGIDVAGTVEAVGDAVTRFEAGDEVYGASVTGHQWKNGGAFAELAAIGEDILEPKPANVTFEQAAAAPTSGLIALTNVWDAGGIAPGNRVLVNGAGGGVGSFSVQIAKAYGATVTAVDREDKLDMLAAIGADHVLDYTKDDFTTQGERYHMIIDIPGNRSFEDLKRVVADGGRYVLIGHDNFGAAGNRWIGGSIGRFLKLSMLAPFGRLQTDRSVADESPQKALHDLLASGNLKPVIDRTFDLSEVIEALQYLEDRATGGSIVMAV